MEERETILTNRRKIKNIIIKELEEINKKYPMPRKTSLVYASEVEEYSEEQQVEDYPVTLFLSREGYFKKITAQSLRMSGEQKYKDGDTLKLSFESTNRRELLVLTDKQQIYKTRVADFEDCKASVLGVYLPTKLGMDEGESVVTIIDPGEYKSNLLLAFENGKIARIEMAAYETKTNRKKLINAYSDKSPLVSVIVLEEETDVVCYSSDDRALIFNPPLLQPKSSRSTQGVGVLTLKARRSLVRMEKLPDTGIRNASRYRVRSLPAAGGPLKSEEKEEQQLSMLEE